MTIKSREDYSQLEKGIVILISDYELESLKGIKKYITKWNIREEDYKKTVLTDVMEIYIIELPKFEMYEKDTKNIILNLWMKFIRNPEVVDMSNKEINKAKEVLEEISKDERERYLTELRQKYIMDQKAIEDAGYDKGLKTGMERGLRQAKEQLEKEKIQIAKELLKQKVQIDIISKATGLSVEQIKKI